VLLEEFEWNDIECLLTRCLENNSWSTACPHGFEPSSRTKAPSITRYEPRKIEFRSWCDEIVSCFDCKLKKGLSHDGTNSMGTGIIRTCSAKAISKKSSEWFRGAWNQWFAKKVAVMIQVR
jgi:uncharacterized protein YfaT (DUF1175 family)